jgi:hypothetical protein
MPLRPGIGNRAQGKRFVLPIRTTQQPSNPYAVESTRPGKFESGPAARVAVSRIGANSASGKSDDIGKPT